MKAGWCCWIIVVLKIAYRPAPAQLEYPLSGPSRLVSGCLPGVKYISKNPFNTCHLPQFSPVGSNLVTAASHVVQLWRIKALLFSPVCHRLLSTMTPLTACCLSFMEISLSPLHKVSLPYFLPTLLFLHFPLKLLCCASSSALSVRLINDGLLPNAL